MPPFWGVDQAVREIEWAKANGLGGIMLPHMWMNQDPYHHPKYDPMWAACQDNGIVIHFHSGAAPAHEYFGMALFDSNANDFWGTLASAEWTRDPAGFGGARTMTWTVPSDEYGPPAEAIGALFGRSCPSWQAAIPRSSKVAPSTGTKSHW